MLLASGIAALHAGCVLVMLAGGLVGLRRPAVLRVWVPVALGVLAVNLSGLPCPLTELEQSLRVAAGEGRYAGGFLEHYVLAPAGLRQSAVGVQAGIYAVALLPNVLACALLARSRVGRPVPA